MPRLSPLALFLASCGLFFLGAALPYLQAPEPLRLSIPPGPRPFDPLLPLWILANNGAILLLLAWGLPALEVALRLPKAVLGQGYLLASALVAGFLATPHGLPQSGWYALLVFPLVFLEYGAYTLALFRRRAALGLLLAAVGYEALILAWL